MKAIGPLARALPVTGRSLWLASSAMTLLSSLAKYSTIPVLNGMSDYSHPTQVIADVITILENCPKAKS